jgi:hypothetical protein
VTLSLIGIFIFTSPFLRVLAVLISARWMVLRFTDKQVNTSYSSEKMIVMLFLCNSLDSHPTIIFKPNGSFCRPTTSQNPEKWRSKDEDSKERQSHTEKTHSDAFDIVKSFIEQFVILGKSVVKLNKLREIYVSKLAETEFSNPNYRSENLKHCASSQCDFAALWNLHLYFSISQGFGSTYFCKMDGTALHRQTGQHLLF